MQLFAKALSGLLVGAVAFSASAQGVNLEELEARLKREQAAEAA